MNVLACCTVGFLVVACGFVVGFVHGWGLLPRSTTPWETRTMCGLEFGTYGVLIAAGILVTLSLLVLSLSGTP